MRSLKCFLIPLMLILLMNVSCSNDDEVTLTGKLELYFHNSPPDLRVQIFTIENSQTPVYEFSAQGNRDIKLSLNMGNYKIRPYSLSSSNFYGSTGFQIVQGKTTSISYDERNGDTVTIND